MDVARRDNSGTEGESEVEGVFCVTYSDSQREAVPCSIP